MSPGGLSGRLVTVGAGTLQLSLGVIRAVRLGCVLPGLVGPGLSLGRPELRAGHRLVPFLPRCGRLLLRGPCLLLGGGLRLPRLGQPRLGLPRGQARLPRISLGLLGRRELRFQPGPQPGLVPRGVPVGRRGGAGRLPEEAGYEGRCLHAVWTA